MPQYKYSVSLRIFHPKMKASDISDAMSQEPTSWHNVGTECVSKSGKKLGGVYEDTLWSLSLNGKEKIDAENLLFEDFIETKNTELFKYHGFLKSINHTGGSIEYFVGWFSEGSINMNIVLEPTLMKETSKLGITIILCAYPEN